jgi:hypothetical protein
MGHVSRRSPPQNHCVVVEIHKFLEEDNDTLHMYILRADRQELPTRAGPVTEAEDVAGRATTPEGEVGPRKGTRPRKKNS